MLMAFLMFVKWWKVFLKKNHNYIINGFFFFLKQLDKVYSDFKQ